MRDRILEIIINSKNEGELLDNLEDFIMEQIWHVTIED